MEKTCLQCGNRIPERKDSNAPGFVIQGSMSLYFMDPRGFFCTLRCAARYGVKAAYARYPLEK